MTLSYFCDWRENLAWLREYLNVGVRGHPSSLINRIFLLPRRYYTFGDPPVIEGTSIKEWVYSESYQELRKWNFTFAALQIQGLPPSPKPAPQSNIKLGRLHRQRVCNIISNAKLKTGFSDRNPNSCYFMRVCLSFHVQQMQHHEARCPLSWCHLTIETLTSGDIESVHAIQCWHGDYREGGLWFDRVELWRWYSIK